MRISLSPKNDERGKHLVLTVDRSEEIAGVSRVIEKQIMDGKRAVRETITRKAPGQVDVIEKVIYRFHLGFLERIYCTFPQAEWSPKAENYRRRMLLEHVLQGPTPECVVPGFKGHKLFDLQKKAIIWIEDWLDDFHAAMVNDEMGLGKTLDCYGVIDRDKNYFETQQFKRILVITTNSGKRAWWKIAKRPTFEGGKEVEPAKFPKLDIGLIEGTKAQRQRQLREKHHIIIVNEQMLRIKDDGTMIYPELFKREWDLIIVDEYHHFKNPHAQVSAGFLELRAKNFIIMSGTPFLNRPEELWTSFHRTDPEAWPDYATFVAALTIMGKGRKIVGYQRKQVKRIRTFLAERSIRRKRSDVEDELPQVMPPTEIRVELTAEQRKLYDKLLHDFLMELEDGTIKRVTAALAHITRLKQACFSPELYGGSKESIKLDKLREIVDELVANGEKAIIFSQWEQAAQIIKREFEDYNPAYVTGKINPKFRSVQEDRFNEDPDCKLYIGTIDANQESISLGAATYVIFVDQPWNPYKKQQARDRSASGGFRGMALGKDKKVYVIDLHAENTIEEWLDEILARKSRLFSALIEQDGGTQIKKTTIQDIKELLRAKEGSFEKAS
jgi:SNF2 family DNA or RNA helicase